MTSTGNSLWHNFSHMAHMIWAIANEIGLSGSDMSTFV